MDYTCYRCGDVKVDDDEGVFVDRLRPVDNLLVVVCATCAVRGPLIHNSSTRIKTFSNYFEVVNATEFILWMRTEWPGFKIKTGSINVVKFSRADSLYFMGDMDTLRRGIQKRLAIHSSCIIIDIAHRNAHYAVITRSKYENVNMKEAAYRKAQEMLEDSKEMLEEEPTKRKIRA